MAPTDRLSLSSSRLLRFAAWPGRVVAVSALLSSAACSSRQATPVPPIDCAAVVAPYEFDILETYDQVPPWYGWYGYGDNTPGASWVGQVANAPPVMPIENGGPCSGSGPTQSGAFQDAMFLSGHGFQDYGNGWGTYSIGIHYPALAAGPQAMYPDGGQCYSDDAGTVQGVCPIDGSAFDGVTFWARSFDPTGASTSKGFTVTINDKESGFGVGSSCVPYEAGTMANGSATYTAPTSGSTGPAGGGTVSAVPPADACGNGFTLPMLVTDTWQLYTLPWSVFHQSALPDRMPTMGVFDPSSFMQIIISFPKESYSALWIDSFGFYRAKRSDAGAEAGP